MQKKRKIAFNLVLRLSLFFSLILLSSQSAFALIPTIISTNLRRFFMSVPDVYLLKFAFFVIAFAALYYSATKFVFKDAKYKGVAVTIALSISLLSALMIPATLVRPLFNSYGWIIALLMLFAPVVGMLVLGRNMLKGKDGKDGGAFARGARALFFAIAAYYCGMIGTLTLGNVNFLGPWRSDVLNMSDIADIAAFIFIILAIYNLFQALMGMGGKGGKDGSGKGDKGDNKGDKGDKGDKSDGSGDEDDDKKRELEKEREKFEKACENPAYLKIWVRDLDDRNLQNAIVTVRPLKFSKEMDYKNHPTNKDGIAPGDGGAFIVPSNYPVEVSVKYRLQKNELYKSRDHWIKIGPLEFLQKRYFSKRDVVNALKAGETHTHEMKLEIRSEYPLGFEPFIENVEIKDGKINTEGILKSNTGGRPVP